MTACFEVVMFDGLTSSLSFDYVMNDKKEKDFLIRDFNVATD